MPLCSMQHISLLTTTMLLLHKETQGQRWQSPPLLLQTPSAWKLVRLSGTHPQCLSDVHLTLQANQAENKVAWFVLPHSESWEWLLFPAHAAEGFPFILGIFVFVPAVCTSSCLSLVEKEAPFTASLSVILPCQLTPACIPQIDADWKRTQAPRIIYPRLARTAAETGTWRKASLLLSPLLEFPLSVHWNSCEGSTSADTSARECASKVAS